MAETLDVATIHLTTPEERQAQRESFDRPNIATGDRASTDPPPVSGAMTAAEHVSQGSKAATSECLRLAFVPPATPAPRETTRHIAPRRRHPT